MRRPFRILIWAAAVLALLVAAFWLAFVPPVRGPRYVIVAAWGGAGTGPGQFAEPTGLAVHDGELFVSDARNGRIQVFDLDGRFRRQFGKPGDGPGRLGRPMGLVVHGNEIFIPEYFNDRIQVFGLDGTPKRIIGHSGNGLGEFNSPGGIAVGRDGSLYVADFYNHRVQQLNAGGAFVRQWGTTGQPGRGDGEMRYPTGVALTSAGSLIVADAYNNRIQTFAPDGSFVRAWGGPFAMGLPGPLNGWFHEAIGVSVLPDGRIAVADFFNNRIQIFSADGKFLTSFGTRGSGAGQFHNPIAVAAGPDGSLFVADLHNQRIEKWRPLPGGR